MVVTSYDAVVPTEMLRNVLPSDASPAEREAQEAKLLAGERKYRDLAVYRERAFLKRLGGAVGSSVGRGRGSLISRTHVRRVFEHNLVLARAFGGAVRAARQELAREKRGRSARDPQKALEEKLRASTPLGADAANRILTNARAVWEAALIQTEADFDLVERTGATMDALRKLVRGVSQRAK